MWSLQECGKCRVYKNVVNVEFTRMWLMWSLQEFGKCGVYKNVVNVEFTRMW